MAAWAPDERLKFEKGAYFDGRAKQAHGANGREPERATKSTLREARDAEVAAE